jgi:hypothetical protein
MMADEAPQQPPEMSRDGGSGNRRDSLSAGIGAESEVFECAVMVENKINGRD